MRFQIVKVLTEPVDDTFFSHAIAASKEAEALQRDHPEHTYAVVPVEDDDGH